MADFIFQINFNFLFISINIQQKRKNLKFSYNPCLVKFYVITQNQERSLYTLFLSCFSLPPNFRKKIYFYDICKIKYSLNDNLNIIFSLKCFLAI